MADEVAIRQEGTSNIALPWHDGGCSVVPIKTDGSKRPAVEWGPLQKERLTRAQVEKWWRVKPNVVQPGVAVICGKVSGDLEMVEIEGGWTDSEHLALVSSYCESAGVRGVWEDLLLRGYAEWSPSGGIHVLYRLKDGVVSGNTKLASTREGKTKAETRGEGGYVIVAPTGGQCHPSGEPWTTVAGEPGLIPYLTMAERDAIHAAITAALDESPPPAPPTPAVKREVLLSGEVRPGDDFNARVGWPEILEPHGWRVSERRGQETLWVRPDKARKDGHSASTGYANDADRMYVWSTSAGLPTEQPLSKFFVHTALNHGGDFREATRSLSRLGFGEQARSQTEGWATQFPAAEVAVREPAGTVVVDELPSQGEVPQKSVNLMFTDTGNANRMRFALEDRFRFVPARSKWMMFYKGAWIVDHGAIALKQAIADKVYDFYLEAEAKGDQKGMKHWTVCQSESRISAMAKMMRGQENVFTTVEEFDAVPELLNLTNGTVNLETGEVHAHNSFELLTKKMNVGYDPLATAPRWEAYLNEVLPDPEMRDFLQRAVGYSLTGEPVERALFILHGPGGTGKSRFIETLTTLFGSYGTTAADSLFRSKRDQPSGVTNDLNDLKGARLASVSELDSGVRMDEALVKRLTGFDTITSRGLYEENTTWRPQCAIWLATNHHFKISSDDGAIWKRLKVIPFTQEITQENEDPHILKKLLAERNGIFNWMLEGLQKYRERGLILPEGAQDALRKYKSEQDPVEQFVNEMLDECRLFQGDGKDDFIEKAVMFKLYISWSKDQGELPLGKTRFNRRMEALGFEEFKRSRMYWRGLRANEEYGIMGSM